MIFKFLFKKGIKNPSKLVGNAEKVHYTVNYVCSAAGIYFPPFIIYKAKLLHSEWCTDGPKDAVYAVSPSGWMEAEQFVQWFESIFLKYTSDLIGDKILFLDGHNSHLSIKLIHLAIKNQVHLLCLPAHTSHALQPLDVGVFSEVKRIWKKNLVSFYQKTGGKSLNKQSFPKLLKELHQEAFLPQHAVAGFFKTDLFPLNAQKVNTEMTELNKPHEKPEIAESGMLITESVLSSSVCSNQDSSTSSFFENSSKNLNDSILKHLSFCLSNKSTAKKRSGIETSGKCLTENEILDKLEEKAKKTEELIKNKAEKKLAREIRVEQAAQDKIEKLNAKLVKAKSEAKIIKTRKTPLKANQVLKVLNSNAGTSKSFEADKTLSDEKNCSNCQIKYKSARNPSKWLGCEACSSWICDKCLPKNFDLTNEYYCPNCADKEN